MKKIFGIKIPSKKPLTVEDFMAAATACGYTNAKFTAVTIRCALVEYAGDEKKLTQAFLCKIPDDQIETIKGIKSAGHKIINQIKEW